MRKTSRKLQYRLAREAFYELVEIAKEEARRGNVERAAQIGRLAFKVAKKGKVRIPLQVKRSFCRNCYVPLIPGVTARVRLRRKGYKTVVVTCLNCGRVRRYPVISDEGKGPSSD